MVWHFIGVYIINWRYEISLLVWKKTFHEWAALTREILFNTRREIFERLFLCFTISGGSSQCLNFEKFRDKAPLTRISISTILGNFHCVQQLEHAVSKKTPCKNEWQKEPVIRKNRPVLTAVNPNWTSRSFSPSDETWNSGKTWLGS